MRILFLTSRLPYPPDRGDRLRAFNFLRQLSKAHEIHLVSFIASEAATRHLAALAGFCRSLHVVPMSPLRSAVTVGVNFWRPYPLQALYYRHSGMARQIQEVVQTSQIDMAYIHLFRMAPYLANHPEIYRVVDLTDVISREVRRSLPFRGGLSRLVYTLEGPRIVRYERQIAREFDETWLISRADAEVLSKACPDANIQTVTNGVDTARFYPLSAAPDPDQLIFVGHMGVFHNIDAATHLAENILPLIRHRRPNCQLAIVGADPVPQIKQLEMIPGVTVTGFVPDLNEKLNQAAVFAAPLRFAAGVQNKVLEAMATGTPVVTTPLVNEGVGAQAGRDILLADDPAAFTEHVVGLLESPDRARQVGGAGREFVVQKFNWEKVGRRVHEIEAKHIVNG